MHTKETSILGCSESVRFISYSITNEIIFDWFFQLLNYSVLFFIYRAKWDAYKRLGTMSKEQAMECYVDELKKIIETMSYTDNVANFMGSISELEGVNVNDLEVIAPEAIKKVKSQPNSPFASRESSPIRTPMLTNGNGNGHVNGNGNGALINYENGNTNGNGVPYLNGGYTLQNGHTIEQSDDEYIDTVDVSIDDD